ncbi:Cytochrome c oxidase polypeptide III [Rhodopirellula islandica]|uniref:Cytochrome c oxidase polypeptide III n=1 Tax=Rhodopirellula islandica TaxID=595434 RepID=A0A0J1BCP7_RHOIS|nr:cytochrome c oxidase subunit 3 [Rhodopirellula islandica]KLU04343.1 Cytochrome c oxidase polypeptide III [Rhodopirellula islandica]
MATIDSVSSPTDAHADDSHGHDHDHPSWLAHHFETPEQQFDSGKLGIWLFLVTEILFFSGMFCAYAILRMLRPEVFEGCSQFLNTKLGAINTGVLLFSSLTMAWAVRCSQTEEHKKLVALIATTLSCAMVFLGVKSIEYSHKWGMGLLPPGTYFYSAANEHPTAAQMVELHGFSESTAFFLTNSLYFLCAPFALIAAGVFIWLVVSKISGNAFQYACAKPLLVVALSFFGGVGLGTILESGGEHHGDEHVAAAGDHADAEHGDADHSHAVATVDHAEEVADESDANMVQTPLGDDYAAVKLLAENETNTGLKDLVVAEQTQQTMAEGKILKDSSTSDAGISTIPGNVNTPRQAGVFFGIYYCMTGVHAIHILAGIGVLVWLLIRAIRQDFNRHYFGPVDYVGLYWHIVDLIWIYLFPLLYLIR